MFKNRKLALTVEKVDKKQNPETSNDSKNFEKKAEFVLRKLEGIGAKMFLGVCVYIILDTRRQVAVAEAIYHPNR